MTARWSEALYVSSNKNAPSIGSWFSQQMLTAPGEFLIEISHALGSWLKSVAKEVEGINEGVY